MYTLQYCSFTVLLHVHITVLSHVHMEYLTLRVPCNLDFLFAAVKKQAAMEQSISTNILQHMYLDCFDK